MSIELDTNEQPQTRADLSDAERTAADKGHDDAFKAAFESDEDNTAAGAPAPAHEPEARREAPTPPPPAPAPAVDDEDPFKGFSPKARELFAKIPELENDNRSLRGRVPVLQRENEDLKRRLAALETAPPAPAAPAAPAASSALDKVRGELPEVADAIDEAFRALQVQRTAAPPPPAPAPAPSADHADDEATILSAAHKDWAPTMNSADFKLWVAVQPEDYQRTVMSTDKAAPVIEALTKFKAHQAAARERATATQTEADRRNKRTSRGVTPGGNAAPLTPGVQSEHDAFLAGFNSPD